ncbi:MAG: TraR/DksA C4-type zinc finger protein [Chthoniobacterales bacterium]|nr:TraR/DksA C4-type zinc finger protein [Chthoniobacterales bacterium]
MASTNKKAKKKGASVKPVKKAAAKAPKKTPVKKAASVRPAKKARKVAPAPKASALPRKKGSESETKRILANNHKERRLDPFTRGQKDKLLQLRDAMVDSMAGVAQDTLRSRAEGSEASAFGMHQADAGSDAYDRDFALSLLSQEQDALYEIDQALKRIELGTYGVCEMSSKAIPHARLEAIPFARFTVECQSQLEKQNKASRVRQSVTSLFGLTDEEGGEGEEEEAKPEDTKE